MEHQKHGNDFENEIHLAVHGKTKKEYEQLLPGGHIAELDIQKGVLSNFNGSVKVTGKKSVACGDLLRMYTNTKQLDITVIIGKWDRVGSMKKEYRKIYEFYLNPPYSDLLWGGMQFDTLQEFTNYVRTIPYGKKSQLANQKRWKAKRDNIYESEGKGLMSMNAKIDSGVQRRVQCSFKIDDMIKYGISHKIFTKEYRGIDLPLDIASK
ncbi:MAG: hypothetical protein QGH83_02520 [Candidatus Pacebacteria bacterium]|nr:hypothetical protein [Candidatus Paceibacterota bacterium]